MTGMQRLARGAGTVIFSVLFVCTAAISESSAPTGSNPQTAAAAPKQQQFAAAPKLSRIQEELRGDVFVAEKRYSEAIDVYQALLRTYPRDATLLNKIGIAFHQELNFRQAKKYYERAIHADPRYASAVNNLGAIEYAAKNYKKAIRQYDKAIAIDPTVGSFYSNLGYANFGMKRFDAAMAAFRKAIQIDPTLFEQHGQAGTVLMERSVEDRGAFFFYLAKSFAQAGNAERCAAYLRKSRDEGYKSVAAAKTDPAFAAVREDPLVKDILDSLTPPAKPPSFL
jgi:tetratricopeptide (TPR) repeat protein